MKVPRGVRGEIKKFENDLKGGGGVSKVLIEENFEYEGETYGPGETVDLPEDVAREAIENGAAKSVEEIESDIEIKPGAEVEGPPSPKKLRNQPVDESEEGFPEEVSVPAREGRAEESEPDVWEELERELEEPSRAPTWRSEEVGNQLLGEVTRTGRGPNGRLLEVRTPEGENMPYGRGSPSRTCSTGQRRGTG